MNTNRNELLNTLTSQPSIDNIHLLSEFNIDELDQDIQKLYNSDAIRSPIEYNLLSESIIAGSYPLSLAIKDNHDFKSFKCNDIDVFVPSNNNFVVNSLFKMPKDKSGIDLYLPLNVSIPKIQIIIKEKWCSTFKDDDNNFNDLDNTNKHNDDNNNNDNSINNNDNQNNDNRNNDNIDNDNMNNQKNDNIDNGNQKNNDVYTINNNTPHKSKYDNKLNEKQSTNVLSKSNYDFNKLFYGYVLVLHFDLDCCRFFMCMNKQNTKFGLFTTSTGLNALKDKTNRIDKYNALSPKVHLRAEKYNARGFKYVVENNISKPSAHYTDKSTENVYSMYRKFKNFFYENLSEYCTLNDCDVNIIYNKISTILNDNYIEKHLSKSVSLSPNEYDELYITNDVNEQHNSVIINDKNKYYNSKFTVDSYVKSKTDNNIIENSNTKALKDTDDIRENVNMKNNINGFVCHCNNSNEKDINNKVDHSQHNETKNEKHNVNDMTYSHDHHNEKYYMSHSITTHINTHTCSDTKDIITQDIYNHIIEFYKILIVEYSNVRDTTIFRTLSGYDKENTTTTDRLKIKHLKALKLILYDYCTMDYLYSNEIDVENVRMLSGFNHLYDEIFQRYSMLVRYNMDMYTCGNRTFDNNMYNKHNIHSNIMYNKDNDNKNNIHSNIDNVMHNNEYNDNKYAPTYNYKSIIDSHDNKHFNSSNKTVKPNSYYVYRWCIFPFKRKSNIKFIKRVIHDSRNPYKFLLFQHGIGVKVTKDIYLRYPMKPSKDIENLISSYINYKRIVQSNKTSNNMLIKRGDEEMKFTFILYNRMTKAMNHIERINRKLYIDTEYYRFICIQSLFNRMMGKITVKYRHKDNNSEPKLLYKHSQDTDNVTNKSDCVTLNTIRLEYEDYFNIFNKGYYGNTINLTKQIVIIPFIRFCIAHQELFEYRWTSVERQISLVMDKMFDIVRSIFMFNAPYLTKFIHFTDCHNIRDISNVMYDYEFILKYEDTDSGVFYEDDKTCKERLYCNKKYQEGKLDKNNETYKEQPCNDNIEVYKEKLNNETYKEQGHNNNKQQPYNNNNNKSHKQQSHNNNNNKIYKQQPYNNDSYENNSSTHTQSNSNNVQKDKSHITECTKTYTLNDTNTPKTIREQIVIMRSGLLSPIMINVENNDPENVNPCVHNQIPFMYLIPHIPHQYVKTGFHHTVCTPLYIDFTHNDKYSMNEKYIDRFLYDKHIEKDYYYENPNSERVLKIAFNPVFSNTLNKISTDDRSFYERNFRNRKIHCEYNKIKLNYQFNNPDSHIDRNQFSQIMYYGYDYSDVGSVLASCNKRNNWFDILCVTGPEVKDKYEQAYNEMLYINPSKEQYDSMSDFVNSFNVNTDKIIKYNSEILPHFYNKYEVNKYYLKSQYSIEYSMDKLKDIGPKQSCGSAIKRPLGSLDTETPEHQIDVNTFCRILTTNVTNMYVNNNKLRLSHYNYNGYWKYGINKKLHSILRYDDGKIYHKYIINSDRYYNGDNSVVCLLGCNKENLYIKNVYGEFE